MPEPFKVSVKVEGGPQLLKEFAALGGNVRSTSRSAIRAGAKVIQAQAEVNAQAIATRPAKHTQIKISQRVKGTIEAMIGPSKRKWFYRYFETGVTPHEITGAPLVFEGDAGLVVIGGVNHPGLVARPWLRPAFDSKQGEAPAAIEAAFRKAIEDRRAIIESDANDNGDD